MEIKPISEIMNPAGLSEPLFNILIPDTSNYKALIMQPNGEITADAAGVRNRNRDIALKQYKRFLVDAHESEADLVITPEYSMPWETLIEVIKEGIIPKQGKLWVLGCESIKLRELENMKNEHASLTTILFEPLDPDETRFVDPLAYVFSLPSNDSEGLPKIVMVVQFKTKPMGDDNHFEINGLQKGKCLYQLGGNGQSLKMISLICSDAFDFEEHINTIYDRALIIHIQLIKDPRHNLFRRYKDKLFCYPNDETELICVNWAKNIQIWGNGTNECWNNIGGSAWYSKSRRFDTRDETLCVNHRRGLYYTWFSNSHTHASYFNYEPMIYCLQATKVAHLGVPATHSRRRGPQLIKTFCWEEQSEAWVEIEDLDDGFSLIIQECSQAKNELNSIYTRNPFELERIVLLSTGSFAYIDEWHELIKLDSCNINATEIIKRLTFCQDTNLEASDYRIAKLKSFELLWKILANVKKLPLALNDLSDGFYFKWERDTPHQNIISTKTGKLATVIYMGEVATNSKVESVYKYASEFLRRAYPEPDECRDARQRLAVWVRGFDDIVLYNEYKYLKYDDPGVTSEFDIGRET